MMIAFIDSSLNSNTEDSNKFTSAHEDDYT